MPLTQESIIAALKTVKYPGYTRDIVSFNIVKELHVHDGHIAFTIQLSSADPKIVEELRPAIAAAMRPFQEQAKIDIRFSVIPPNTTKPLQNHIELKNIKHKIAIASGKGGVGKSTVTANLAYALSAAGAKVGVMDCDVYGPTIPLMLGFKKDISGDILMEDGKILPYESHGLKIMSMGFFIDDNTPVVWRGPMITKTIQQFTSDVNWGELDYLLIDLPPGTGDAQLTLTQTIALDGVIIVTTPQLAAAQVAARGAQMFGKVNVPVLGVIENMSYYALPNGEKDYFFGRGGGSAVAEALGVPLLAELPIESKLRECADAGKPILSVNADSVSSKAYRELAGEISRIISKK